MLEKKMLDLLNQELDNANTQKGRSSVKKLLAKKSEAKKYFDDLQELSTMFRSVSDVPAPPHLKAKILHALPFPLETPVPRKAASHGFFQQFLFSRYGVTFAGGALAGILLFALITGQPSDTFDMAGTMAPNESLVLAEHSINIELTEVAGTIAAKRFNSAVIAELDLQATDEVDVIVNFDQQQLHFDSFHPENEAQGTLVVLEGQLRLTVKGPQKYEIGFSGNPQTPLTARVFARGILLSEYELSLNQEKKY